MIEEQQHHEEKLLLKEEEEEEKFREFTVKGEWNQVMRMSDECSRFCMVKINESSGSALHVAVNEGKEFVVESLVNAIVKHNRLEAFELKNERGDTPLHLAATRGFKDICKCIIGEEHEKRVNLISIPNNDGETPLFQAVLSWQKPTFLYLCDTIGNVDYNKDLIQKNGDSILHCAIRREFFDLALIIMKRYPKLYDIQNKEGFSPLKVLATRPSAFKSGSNLSWWKKILYCCVSLETDQVHDEETNKLNNKADKQKYLPKNYSTCYQLYLQFQLLCKLINSLAMEMAKLIGSGFKKKPKDPDPESKHQESESEPESEIIAEGALFPPNYDPCLQAIKLAYVYTLGLSGVGVEDIKNLKQKHKWSSELLSEFMKTPYDSYKEYGGPPALGVSAVKTDILSTYKTENIKEKKIVETVILVAARHGIVEMVKEILSNIPSAIHETNSEKKNVLLVAVENRQTRVVEALKDQLGKDSKSALDNLILGVDEHENTVLHLAATPTNKDWSIPGAALQMMWHVKWFEYIKGLVPGHVIVRTNNDQKTAGEMFKESHPTLVKDASDWLKDTSESCSVVAALLAGVSFATSSSIPGGNSDSGQPALRGEPAFEAFALCSLLGLCFSVTALIMFLSILTSRKEAKDFRASLPLKVLLGLSSLFISITALFATFLSGHFFVIDDKFKQVLFLMYAVTCLPVTLYAIAQFPLYIDLLRAIATKVPQVSDKGDDL